MTKETIKIEEDVKERLDEIKELPRFKYAEPSYSGCIEYLLDKQDGTHEVPDVEDDATQSGGDGTSDEDEDFRSEEVPGDDELTAEERVNRVRVDE